MLGRLERFRNAAFGEVTMQKNQALKFALENTAKLTNKPKIISLSEYALKM